jgi:hypothetical protein
VRRGRGWNDRVTVGLVIVGAVFDAMVVVLFVDRFFLG